MSRYRKQPVEVEAFQLKDIPWPDWFEEALDTGTAELVSPKNVSFALGDIVSHAIIHTLEGDHRANLDDYIIRGVKGELYPCKSDIFEQTYDRVED